jgi:hypothetical protein
VTTLGPDVDDIAAALRDVPDVADIDVIRFPTSARAAGCGGALRSR